jgi:PRC-barrel domain
MLRSAKNLHGFTIRATDGELGTVDQLYFDDETWAIRYLTVETGGWLAGRQVLISPISIIHADWQTKRVSVALTKKQVENSPDVDTQQPVSRQHEAAFNRYYGYPYYWGGPYLWGAAPYPADLVTPPLVLLPVPPVDTETSETAYSHLRSTEAVTGYAIEAADGEIGHVDGFVLDDNVWAIRYIEVATRNWWPGKKVLVSPAWIERVSWADSKVYTGLNREAIQNAPEYVESVAISREYENRLYFHYGRPPYWLNEVEHQAPFRERGTLSS